MNKSLMTNLSACGLILIGAFSPYFSAPLLNMGLYALSGAITNWLAIHMLFEKVPFLYGSGVVVNRFESFKSGIRDLIMNEFFTPENLAQFLKGSGFNLDDLKDKIDYDRIFSGLKEAIMESSFGGMLSMFGGEAALDPLKPLVEEKFGDLLSEGLLSETDNTAASAEALHQQIQGIVEARLDELTPQMVKDIVQTMIREHLGWLVVWGGVFGALIGLSVSLIQGGLL